MTNAQDFGALNWVKDELDVSIRQARQALESYVESNDDVSALEICGDHLHQIARVLQMVQVYGPSMLAEEMELVVRDMQQGNVRQQEDAAEALMLALIQLPDYLEKLQGGDADIPLIILPLLNDLRAVRDAPLLSEAALFKPEVDSGRSTPRITGEANSELPNLVKQNRQKFHMGLLAWYRLRDTEQGWPLLYEVFDAIQAQAGTEQVHRLFWVSGALIQGLMDRSIAPGIAVKQLFSRIDRKLKMIIDGGELAVQQDQSSALLKNLLYYIARAESDNALVKQVQDAYNLDQVMPSEDQLAQGRQGLSGSNAELAESIRDAVSIELTRIKDILDLFMRDEKADTEMLSHLEAPIRKLADTLGMIGQGALRSRLNRQADKVQELVEKGSLPEEFELMEMAGDILFVESSLSTIHTGQSSESTRDADGDWGLDLPEGELQNLIKQTVREAKVDIAKAKEVIIGYTEATDDASVLESVRDGFKRVEGALRMLNLPDAAEILQKTGSFIQLQLIQRSEPPQRHQLNYLADVISSIEYYMETLVDGAGDRQEILSIANASLNNLLSEGGEVTEYTEPAEVISLSGSADHTEGLEVDEDSISDLELGESSLQLDTPEMPDEVSIDSAPADMPEPEPVEPQAEKSEPAAPAATTELDEIDPEILEIFIEEAREELQTIQQRFPQWRQDQNDQDSLTTFRRSFHTLKGSGRLVGAHVIGELAWSVENMLNRLIEETISISPQMLGLMDRVIDALPELIDCQEKGTVPKVDVKRLEQDAFTLAEGKIPEEIPLEAATDTSVDEEVEELELSMPETPSEEIDLSETVDEISLIEPSSVLDESESLIEMELPEEDSLEQPLPHELEDEDTSLRLDSDISGLSALSEEAAPSSQAQAFDDSDLDVEVDSELLNIFAEESEVHLKEIESFLQIATSSQPPVVVNEEVARACHTLRGSANMAGILPIARLSETMEVYTRTLFEQKRRADSPVTDLLGSSVSCIRDLLSWLPGEELPEPPYEACLDRLQNALSELSEGSASEISDAAESEAEAELEPIEAPATESDEPWDLDEVSSLTGLTVDSESLGDISTLSELIPPDEDNQFVVDEDEELIDIFVEESRELLENLDRDFDAWTASPDDTETTDEIKRALHTLKGSSRLAGINPVGDLSHGLETLFNRLGLGQVEFSEPLSHLVREALDHLASQTDQAAAFRRVALADDLMARLDQMSQAETSADAEAAIDPRLQRELEEADESADSSQLSEDTGTADYYEEPLSFIRDGDLFEFDGDTEMVEIFTEESRELLSSLDESYAVWLEKRDDADSLDEFQRALHTLKGSSRLAGLEPVGDLSHALESVMAAVSLSKLEPTDEVAGASREALDLLASQTDAAEAKAGIPQADALIKRLHKLLEEPAFEQESIDPQLQKELAETAATAEPEAEAVELESSSPEAESISVADDALTLLDDESEETDESFLIPGDDLLLELGEDDELVQIFIEEAKDFIEQIDANFQTWMEQTDDLTRIESIQRNLHTLKGSSRLAGIMPVGDLSHAIESLMTALAEQEVDPLPVVTDAARQAIDFLAHQVDTIANVGKVPASEDLVEGLHSLLGGELETATSGMVETIQVDRPAEDEAEQAEEIEQPQQTAEIIPLSPNLEALLSGDDAQEKEEGAKRKKEQVRVNSELMDRLVNHAGEVSIYRARLEQQNSVLGFNLAELEQTVSRLYSQLRSLEIETEAQILYRWDRETENSDAEKAEFDPLEMDRFSTIQQLSRALAETVNDLGNINESLNDLQRETDTLLLQQSRISTDLQDGLLRTRMVPFAQLVPRLQRLVRQTANQLNKKANLECFGTEGELDRGILNRMIPVFEHLLRNSVSHGIETPADREASGKPESGRISLYVDREANDVLITLSDDGKGLDIEAIRKRALENGVIDVDAEISDDDLIQCVLIPGFSTAKEVTQISGRGVGLDVVTSEVKQLGGSLEIDSQPGRGTSFIIRLPLTLAITDALLMRVGDEICAIPHGSVEGVVRVRRKELKACYSGEQDGYVYAGKNYKVEYLGRMMGIGQHELPETTRWFPLLLVQSGEHQVALQVDELLGTRQVVVKSLGKQVASVRWITGGTILADGRVALILDLSALVRMDATHVPGGEVERAGERKRAEERLRVMVVDDSITVRKVTSRLLERNDMEVITAKDGVEAVTMLQEQVPDIMLLDIEMPRMDGFELARHINNSVDYYGLPIIMISSRVGDKHRQRAFDLGVKRCLGKPYQEAELLDSINEVLAEARR